ncbi:MAG: hypothetical protein F6J93_40050 [Oscillatoria sp. SIO1A7]|nr:hypothetical protein [Oscillatoria sp. SIO1A7]
MECFAPETHASLPQSPLLPLKGPAARAIARSVGGIGFWGEAFQGKTLPCSQKSLGNAVAPTSRTDTLKCQI